MKKVVAILTLMAFSVIGVMANGQGEESDGKIVIGAAMQGAKSTFIQTVAAGMYKYAEEHPDEIELKVVWAEDKADIQIAQVERLAGSVDVVILNPVDAVSSSPAVDVCKEAGIPIITVNTTVENQDLADAYVGSNDIQAGELMMQRLIDQIGGKGNVAIIQAVIGHSAQIGRDKGYDNVLKKYPEVNLLYRQPADWAADKAQRLMENWLQRGTRIDAVATHFDMMSFGALYALEERGANPLPVIGGMDCDPSAMQAVKEGRFDHSIWQDGVAQGYHSVRVGIEAAQGKAVEDYIIPFEIATAANIDEYITKAEARDALLKKYF